MVAYLARAKAGLDNATGHLIFAKKTHFGGGYIVVYENGEWISGEVRCDDGWGPPYCLGLCGVTEGNALLGVRCFSVWVRLPACRVLAGGVSSNGR